MPSNIPSKRNLLGSIKAEDDHAMLDSAFYETQTYRSITDEGDLPIIVGRRGSGKSALYYQLCKTFLSNKRNVVIKIEGEENYAYSIYGYFNDYRDDYQKLQAMMKLIWRYALFQQIAYELKRNYKIKGKEYEHKLFGLCSKWTGDLGIFQNISKTIKDIYRKDMNSHEFINVLIESLPTREIQHIILDAIKDANIKVTVLIDKIDEGYQDNNIGTAFSSGVIYESSYLNGLDDINAICFARDNVFRSIENLDNDFSRNIEGKYIRMHWEERELFNMACSRMKISKSLQNDGSSEKTWNRYVKNELSGYEGFRKVLKYTLYRPRDVLSLLNNAFFKASAEDRGEIVLNDITSCAKEISSLRINDLIKEYHSIYGNLGFYVNIFARTKTSITTEECFQLINDAIKSLVPTDENYADARIYNGVESIIELLLSVGFLGVKHKTTSRYVFTHDGGNIDKTLRGDDILLIHPCFWRTLEMTDFADIDNIQEIQDEYEIEILAKDISVRRRDIGQHVSFVGNIPLGKESGAPSKFEEWCRKTIIKCFSNGLQDIELHPNRNSSQRRDIIALYNGAKGVWERIYKDYGCRNIIFEVKNYENATIEDFRQFWSYLSNSGNYGRLMFYICRANDHNPTEHDLEWIKEGYFQQEKKVICIKLTDKFLCGILSKFRNPERINPAESAITKLLNTYERLYLSSVKSNTNRRSKR